MGVIYCFSATGRSREVAELFALRLRLAVTEIRWEMEIRETDTAIVVFPVYCQNIPEPVRAVLPRLRAKHVVLVAAYGRMHHGNVLMEAAGMVSGMVIGAAYVPVGHTYLGEAAQVDAAALEPLLERIINPRRAVLKREFQNPLANLAPKLRGQLGVSLHRNDRCDHCGLCQRACPVGAMEDGMPGKACIRCLRCVAKCPRKALEVRYCLPLRLYLKKKKKNKTILYL